MTRRRRSRHRRAFAVTHVGPRRRLRPGRGL